MFHVNVIKFEMHNTSTYRVERETSTPGVGQQEQIPKIGNNQKGLHKEKKNVLL